MTVAPFDGLQITVWHSVFAEANPFSIALQIFFELDFDVAKAMTAGPAPLIVTPSAPACRAFFFTFANPGIKCCLAGSTISSLMEFPINTESFFKIPTTIAAALETLRTVAEIFTLAGNTLRQSEHPTAERATAARARPVAIRRPRIP